jgi:hypothetical protein
MFSEVLFWDNSAGAIMKSNYPGRMLFLGMALLLVWNLPVYNYSISSSQERFRQISEPDSIESGFLADYINRQQSPENPLFLIRMNLELGDPVYIFIYKGFGSDLIEVSNDLVNKFYSQKIRLINFNNWGYINLSLKNALNSQGFLQFRIPYGNLRFLFLTRRGKNK